MTERTWHIVAALVMLFLFLVGAHLEHRWQDAPENNITNENPAEDR